MTIKQRLGRLLFAWMPITRFLFDQLRREMNAQLVTASYTVLPCRRILLKKIHAQREIYANVASGPFPLTGFVNLDLSACKPEVVEWDCRWSLPFSDGACLGIRAEHFVEHLETREELPAFLADVRRVLRSGGVLRVIVPDAERYLRAYCRDDLSGFRELVVPNPFPADLPTRMDIVNHVFHQWEEYRWGYDFETMAHRLRAAGFSRIQRTAFRNSIDPVLAQDREYHAPDSLYVDAVK